MKELLTVTMFPDEMHTVESLEDRTLIHVFSPERPDGDALEYGPVSFTRKQLLISLPQKQISGILCLPDTDGPCPAVIMSHGYNGSSSDFTEECAYFASHGVVSLAYDFCGGSTRSESSGKTTEMSVLTEQEDLEDVLECVRRLKNVDTDAIFLLGASQGGFVSALAAAAQPEKIRGMILYYPALCIPDDWRRNYASESEIPETRDFWGMMLGRVYFQAARALDPFAVIEKYEKPILLIHGDADEVVPAEYSIEAARRCKNAQLEILAGEPHGFRPAAGKKAAEMSLQLIVNNTVSSVKP